MRSLGPTSWLLLACVCMPLHLSAQSQPSPYEVSVRELRIPPKAKRAFDQGLERLAKKDAAGSLPHFQQAIAEFAGYYEAYDRIGAADLKLWRIPEAEQAFRKSIEWSAGQYAHPQIALGAILVDRGKFVEAESVIRKGLDLEPESWTGHYYLGLAMLGLNRTVEAEKSARDALSRKPDFPKAHILLADIHRREKDYESLLTDLNEYLRLAPDGPDSAWAKTLRESVLRVIFQSPNNSALVQPQPQQEP
jgi:tetratricopeptide (TPR) repeat protein